MVTRFVCVLVALSSLIIGCQDQDPPEADASDASEDSEDSGDSDTGESTDTGEMGDGDGDGAYPAEPHGIELGDVFGIWEWVREDESVFSTEDLHAIPQRAIVIYATTAWCGTCRGEVEGITPTLAERADEIMPVGVIFEDAVGDDPTAQTVLGYNSPGTTFEFVADTERDFDVIFPDELAIPRVLVIDSRDMRIVYKYAGHDVQAFVDAIDDLLQGD